MNVSELRIGNLVTIDNPTAWANLKGVTLVVANIESMLDAHFPNSTGTVGLKGGPKFIERIHQFDEFIQPIPLTEEWLLKFGFVYRNEHRGEGALLDLKNANWKDTLTVGFDYAANGGGIAVLAVGRYNIFFVHQLQNLYFSLTGKELVASI